MADVEVIVAAVVEVPEAGDSQAVALDDGARRDGDLGFPRTIVRRRNEAPPDEDGSANGGEGDPIAFSGAQPQRADAEGEEREGHHGPEPWPGEIGEMQGERAPCEEQCLANEADAHGDPQQEVAESGG